MLRALAILILTLLVSIILTHSQHEPSAVARKDLAPFQSTQLAHRHFRKPHAPHGQVSERSGPLPKYHAKAPRIQPRQSDNLFVLNTSHLLDPGPNYTIPAGFSFSLSPCKLSQPSPEGPYYVSGEFVRDDIRELQQGIRMIMFISVVNYETCKPVPNVYVDIWHANATGVYSGVVLDGNGDTSDLSNLKETFLRGIAATNSAGSVQFQTIFPGHSPGRANHIYVMIHQNVQVLINHTLHLTDTSKVLYVGQLFFDENLTSQIEAYEPYSLNPYWRTYNGDDVDFWQETQNYSDPIMIWALTNYGTNVSLGVEVSYEIAVNTSRNYNVGPYTSLGQAQAQAQAENQSQVSSQSEVQPTQSSGSVQSDWRLVESVGFSALAVLVGLLVAFV